MPVDTVPRIVKSRRWLLFQQVQRLCPFDSTPLTKGERLVDHQPAPYPVLFNMSGYFVTYYDCPKCTYRYEVKE